MPDQPTNPIEALIDGYLDATLTQAQHAELFAALEADRKLLNRFAQLTEFDAICREHAGHALEAELLRNQMLPLSSDPHDSAAANNLLQELADFEASLGDPVAPQAEAELPPIHIDADKLTRQKYAAALSYVLRHTFTPKRIAKLAAAAAVLLGIVLAIVLLTWPDQTEPIANQQPAPNTSSVLGTAPVATLTAEHNANWAEVALAPGSPLRIGDRLTLTAGFAEITTKDGAIAIVEAPATVELLDHSNAIRLHAGKLVGICETKSSKGFLVRTPHMDVTDLGTRFGVDASQPETTHVHVFQGSVQANGTSADQDQPHASKRLTSGQSAKATVAEPHIQTTDYDTASFERIGPRTTILAGTGFGMTAGDTDPNWQITAIDGDELTTPISLDVFQQPVYYETHYPGDPQTSQWLAWLPPDEQRRKRTTYRFVGQIEIPDDFEPSRHQLVGRFMVDDQLNAIHINQNAIDFPETHSLDEDPDAWFQQAYEIVLSEELKPGRNQIAFTIENGIGVLNYVGFRIAWELQTHTTGLTRGQNQ